MKISLEKINKNLLLIEIILLVFMKGSFSASFIPKPYVIVFGILALLTALDLIKNKKIIDFRNSISSRIFWPLACLIAAVLIGWLASVFIYRLPITFNMYLEFGNFIISVGTFLLVLFYSRNDLEYSKKCIYALLTPLLFIPFLLVPEFADHVGLASGGTFNGFTDNVSYVANMFLVPAFYFIVKTLLESKYIGQRILNFVLASALVALLLWSTERAEIIALAIGSIAIWAIIVSHKFSIKKAISNALVILAIFIVAFGILPSFSKKILLDRVLHLDAHQTSYAELQHKSLADVVHSQGVSPTVGVIPTDPSSNLNNIANSESRLKIWPFYINLVARHPLGYGPATHLNATVTYGEHVFTDPGTHNTYLEVWLWGGLLGLISFVYLLTIAGKQIRDVLNKNFNIISLTVAASMVGYAVSIFFNDNIITTSVWVLLAMPFCIWKLRS